MNDLPVLPEEESVWDLREYLDNLEERDPGVELILLSSDDYELTEAAIDYAGKFFEKDGWPKLEERINDWGEMAYWYALNVLNGPFPAGERAIARHAMWSYLYAKHVIMGRFRLGEEAIARSPRFAFHYTRYVVEGQFQVEESDLTSSKDYYRI